MTRRLTTRRTMQTSRIITDPTVAWRLLERGGLRHFNEEYDQVMLLISDDIIMSSFTEGKAPALRKGDPISKQQDLEASLDPRFRRKTGKAFKKYKREMDQLQSRTKKKLAGIVDTYASGRGKLPWFDVAQIARNTLVNAHFTAFELGLRAAGLTNVKKIMEDDPTTSKRVQSAIDAEMIYFERLLDELKDEEVRGSPGKRAQRYAEAVFSSFNQARVMGMPSVSIIHWHLESPDPCNDCKLIARFSPFTRETLPTVPRAGSTRCLDHCYCSLEVVVADERKLGRIRARHLPRKEIMRRLKRQQKRQLGRVI